MRLFSLVCALFGHHFVRDRGSKLYCTECGKVIDA